MPKTLLNIPPTKFKAWHDLESHKKKIADLSISQHFAIDPNRMDDFWLEWEDFIVDFSKNRIDKRG